MANIVKVRITAGGIILAATLALIGGLSLAACGTSSGGATSSNLAKPVRVSVAVEGDTISIPLAPVQNSRNARFQAPTPSGDQPFMAYVLDNGQMYVRSALCPPCGSTDFSLKGNTLICGSCGTIFNATTGNGIGAGGSCADYPKAAVAYQTSDGNIILKKADLSTAYQNTLKPGLP